MTVFDTFTQYTFPDGTMWAAAGYAVNNGSPNLLEAVDGDWHATPMTLIDAMQLKGLRFLRVALPGDDTNAGAQLPNVLQRAYVAVFPNGRVEPLFAGTDDGHHPMGWPLSDVVKLEGYWTHDGNCYMATIPFKDKVVGNFVPWSSAAWANFNDYTQAPNGQFQWLQPDSDGFGTWMPMPGGILGTFQSELCRWYWHPADASMTFIDKAMPMIILGIATAGILSGISAAAAEAADAAAASEAAAAAGEALPSSVLTPVASGGIPGAGTITTTIVKTAGQEFVKDTLGSELPTTGWKYGGATSLTPVENPDAAPSPQAAPVAPAGGIKDIGRWASIAFALYELLS